MNYNRILVTGGFGFIGSNLINYLLAHFPDVEIVNIDKKSYGANPDNVKSDGRVKHIVKDIADPESFEELEGIKAIFHLAAESHVDRSIASPLPFVKSNVVGTLNVLEFARKTGVQKVIAVSTDEIYGSIETGAFKENERANPGNAYSATKAGGEMLCMSYFNTFNLPVIVTRCVNNYGPRQFEEKLIPKVIEKALRSLPVPIFDKGEQRRGWVYVLDHIRDLVFLLEHGRPGEIYNVGEGFECSNNEVVKAILAYLGRPNELICYVPNARPGHDFRYALDYSKIRELRQTPYTPHKDYFLNRLAETIDWYCAKLRSNGK